MNIEDDPQHGIHIPPELPNILKDYVKSAIRTQPYDLVKWSAAYFQALSNGSVPPVKDKLEFPPIVTQSGITPGYLKILVKQFSAKGETVSCAEIKEKWEYLSLDENTFSEIISLGEFEDPVDWQKLIAVAAGYLKKTLTHTMIILCDIFSEEIRSAIFGIPVDLFLKLYMFLANLDAGNTKELSNEDKQKDDVPHIFVPGIGPVIPPENVDSVLKFINSCAEKNGGVVTADDLWNIECPPLD